MNAPFYPHDAFGYPAAMALATLLGFGFGFVLERAGFARSTVLVAQFYGRDLRVLKVMFTAIATAAVGLGLLGELGLVELSALTIPRTFIGPAIVGGLVLGVGFVLAGLCPGTAVVAAASGYVDGVLTLVGVGLGSLLFGLSTPAGFYESGDLGVLTFPGVLGLPWAAVALAVAILAIGSFLFGEWVEAKFRVKDGLGPEPPDAPGPRNRVLGALAAAAATAGLLALTPATSSAPPERTLGAIGPVELALAITGGTRDLWVVDLRSAAACGASRVPGARCLSTEPELVQDLPPTRPLVVYGESGDDAIPTAVGKYGGEVLVLRGGFRAFAEAVLRPPPKAAATPEALAELRLRAALHEKLTGAAAPRLDVQGPPPTVRRAAPKKGGGC